MRRIAPLVAAVLALGCGGEGATPAAGPSVVPDSADQVMFGVHLFLTDAGVRRAELLADTAFTYDDNTRTDLRVVNTTFFKTNGEKDAVLTSRQGTYNVRLGNMEARGDVVVVATDGRKLETPHLRYEPTRNEIASDSAFVLTESNGRVTEGIGFIGDPDLTNVRILRGAKSRGSSIPLPKS